MKDDRKYVRVYYSVIDDERFREVYATDAALALWLRLLLLADAVWPASADVPRSARAKPLAVLVAAGLVELVPPHRFRIHGLDPERSRRRNAAASAAALRWHSGGNADGNAETMPRQDEPSRDETRQEIPPPPAKRGRRKDGTNPRAAGTNPRANGHAPRDEGTSPRQERQRQKQGGAESLASILARANEAGRS